MARRARYHLSKHHGETRAKVFDFIVDFIDANGYSPTLREISDGVGISSICGVSRHVHTLRDEGMIDFKDKHMRTITIT